MRLKWIQWKTPEPQIWRLWKSSQKMQIMKKTMCRSHSFSPSKLNFPAEEICTLAQQKQWFQSYWASGLKPGASNGQSVKTILLSLEYSRSCIAVCIPTHTANHSLSSACRGAEAPSHSSPHLSLLPLPWHRILLPYLLLRALETIQLLNRVDPKLR